MNVLGDPLWEEEDHKGENTTFLWQSERTGRRHLYRLNLEGRVLNTLTAGDWDITRVHGVDQAGKCVYFTGSKEHPLRR